MKIKHFVLGFVLAIFLSACGGAANESTSTPEASVELEEKPAPKVEPPKAMEKSEGLQATDFSRIAKTLVEDLQRLETTYDKAPFCFYIGEKPWFIVANGPWKNSYEQKGVQQSVKLGIVDSDGQEVLPVAYDKIFNPDATAKGFIEIESQGKRGLYGYRNHVLIPPAYDLIFPYPEKASIAIGQKGNDFFYLGEAGEAVSITLAEDIPRLSEMGTSLGYDYLNNPALPLRECYHQVYEDDPEGTYSEIHFLPSYLLALQFFPEYQTFGDGEFGITRKNGGIEEKESVGGGVTAFVSSLFEAGIGVRDGYESERKNLITVNAQNKVLDTAYIGEYYETSSEYFCGSNEAEMRFIDAQLLEVQDIQQTSLHSSMGFYRYYEINEDGTIRQLKSKRLFDCTAFVKMDESYFKVCWSDYVDTEAPDFNWDDGNMWVGSQLSIEDLDIMRNEIFAAYGYQFKGEKWQNYFGKQSWYRPRFDNVDDQLTETDKHNIDLILKVKADMEAHPENYPAPQRTHFVAAG